MGDDDSAKVFVHLRLVFTVCVCSFEVGIHCMQLFIVHGKNLEGKILANDPKLILKRNTVHGKF